MNQETRKRAVRESKELTFRFVECINERDSDNLAAMMSDGFKFTDVAGEVFTVESMSEKKKFWDDYFRCYPDYRIRIDMMLSSGTDIAFIGKTSHSHVPRWVEVNETLIWYVGIAGGQVSEWRIFCTEGYDL
jgi:hypothetical protein